MRLRALLEDFRLDHRRRDAVHPHVGVGQLLTERLGQPDDPGLGRAVVRSRGIPLLASDRGHVHDAPPAGLEHARHKRAAAEEHAVQIDVHHVAPLFRRAFPEHFVDARDAGIIDEDIDMAVPAKRLASRCVDRVRLGQLNRVTGDFAKPVELRLGLVYRRLIAIPDHAPRPVLEQSFNRSKPDPAGAAGHQCRLSL